MLLGHLAGDYLLQNEYLALNKSKNTLNGWLAAFVHCIIYTLAVCVFMWNFDLIWMVAIFFTHFPIDKFRLAEHYMHFIKGKGMKDYVIKDNWINNLKYIKPHIKPAKNKLNRYDILEGGFTALVYTVTDNAMHLILMWGAYQIIY